MMRDFMEIFVPLMLFLVVFILSIVALVATVDYLDCRGFETGTGIETKWAWGCYANVGGQWVPKKYAFGDAHELRIKEK